MMVPDWCGTAVIQFNYGWTRWNMFSRHTSKISYFWIGVVIYLPALRSSTMHKVNSRVKTLF